MLRRLFLLLLLCATGSAVALADRSAACRKNVTPDAQIQACSDILSQGGGLDLLVAARTYRGEAFARKGMMKEATDDFSTVIRMKSDYAAAWIGRGNARLVERKFAEAIADFSVAMRLKPNDGSVLVGRGYAYLAAKNPKLAVSDFTSAIVMNPLDSVALNNRGLAYRKLKENRLALSDYTAAILANPMYALAYNNRGYVHEAMGNRAKAIDDFRHALAIDPSLVGARDALVRLSAGSKLAELSTARVAAGKAIAEKSCAWCHAIGSHGKSPNSEAPKFREIRKRHPILSLREPITRAIATPHDRMPKLSLSDAQIDQLIAYINSL